MLLDDEAEVEEEELVKVDWPNCDSLIGRPSICIGTWWVFELDGILSIDENPLHLSSNMKMFT